MDKTSMCRLRDKEDFSARTVFWGICCESGKKYSQVVRQKFNITMAALEPSDTTVKTPPEKYVSLMVERGGCEYLLCNLQHKCIMQVNLNLIFDQGENVTFFLKGQGKVHLSGYQVYDDAEPCQPKVSEALQSPKPEQNLKKKSLSPSQPAIKEKEVVTVPDIPDEEPSNEKVASKKRKAKVQLSPSGVKKKGNEEKAAEDETSQSKESDMKVVSKKEGIKRLWETLQQMSDEDDDDSDDLEEELDKEDDDDDMAEIDDEESSSDEEQSKDVPQAKTSPLKNLKKDSGLKQNKNKSKITEVVDIEEVEEEDEEEESSSSSDEGILNQSNSSIGRTPMPAKKSKKLSALQPKSSPSLSQSKSPTNKDKKEMSGMSLLKANKGFPEKPFGKKNASGIEIEDIRIGSGPPAKRGKLVHVYYLGKLPNNQVFDSRRPGEKPFSFKLGSGDVIKGLEIGLEGMKAGGKRKIKIPPEMGYGKKAMGDIPANSTLFFIVELKAVS